MSGRLGRLRRRPGRLGEAGAMAALPHRDWKAHGGGVPAGDSGAGGLRPGAWRGVRSINRNGHDPVR